jgi:hypothetical protein
MFKTASAFSVYKVILYWGSSPGRGWEFFSSPPCPDPLWGPPSLLSNGFQGTLSLGVKRPGSEAGHSPPSSAEFKNAWSYTSTPLISFHGVVISQITETTLYFSLLEKVNRFKYLGHTISCEKEKDVRF